MAIGGCQWRLAVAGHTYQRGILSLKNILYSSCNTANNAASDKIGLRWIGATTFRGAQDVVFCLAFVFYISYYSSKHTTCGERNNNVMWQFVKEHD
jgi:hypothetical protein